MNIKVVDGYVYEGEGGLASLLAEFRAFTAAAREASVSAWATQAALDAARLIDGCDLGIAPGMQWEKHLENGSGPAAAVWSEADATRDHGCINSQHGRFEVSANEPLDNSGGLSMEIRDHTTVNYGNGTGWADGILILGMLGRKETDEAALQRLGRDMPDVRQAWADHCDEFRANSRATEASLRGRMEDGFGTGLPVRFG